MKQNLYELKFILGSGQDLKLYQVLFYLFFYEENCKKKVLLKEKFTIHFLYLAECPSFFFHIVKLKARGAQSCTCRSTVLHS